MRYNEEFNNMTRNEKNFKSQIEPATIQIKN